MTDGPPKIELKNLEIGYSSVSGRKVIIRNVDLCAEKRQLIAIIGRNGSGKSTLLRTISRLEKPLSGDIFIEGVNSKKISRNEYAKKVSFVSTEHLNIGNIKVIELISLGRSPYTNWLGRPGEEDRSVVNRVIDLLDLSQLTEKYFLNLSDGEKQKVMIARALAQDTEIILLDEPTIFLDLPSKFEIIQMLGFLSRNENKTMIFSTHDLNIAIENADRIWLVDNGLVIGDRPDVLSSNGSFDQFLKRPEKYK